MPLNLLLCREIIKYLACPDTLKLLVNYRIGTKLASGKCHVNSNMRYFSYLL